MWVKKLVFLFYIFMKVFENMSECKNVMILKFDDILYDL